MLPARAQKFFLVSLALLLFCGSGKAQQNLFNVPSGQITEFDSLFFQQQFNFSKKSGQSNSTFDYGLGNGFEIGGNLLGVSIYDWNRSPLPDSNPLADPGFMLNFQKGVTLIDDCWKTGIGSQFGASPPTSARRSQFLDYNWVINEFQVPDQEKWGKYYAGLYLCNAPYGGRGDRVGGLFGLEIPIVKNKFHFIADIQTGNNDVSIAVIGAMFYVPPGWNLSLGAQLPTPRSHTPYGLVLELTFGAPKD